MVQDFESQLLICNGVFHSLSIHIFLSLFFLINHLPYLLFFSSMLISLSVNEINRFFRNYFGLICFVLLHVISQQIPSPNSIIDSSYSHCYSICQPHMCCYFSLPQILLFGVESSFLVCETDIETVQTVSVQKNNSFNFHKMVLTRNSEQKVIHQY